MGTSRSTAQFVGKLQAAGKAVERARKDALDGVEREFKAAAVKAVAADLTVTGTPQGFSNWRRGKTITLEVAGKKDTDSVLIQPTRQSKGPWRVAESGRRPPVQGPIAAKLLKNGTVSKRQPRRKRFSGSSGGKGTWTDTVDLGIKKMPKRVRGEMAAAMKAAFK